MMTKSCLQNDKFQTSMLTRPKIFWYATSIYPMHLKQWVPYGTNRGVARVTKWGGSKNEIFSHALYFSEDLPLPPQITFLSILKKFWARSC